MFAVICIYVHQQKESHARSFCLSSAVGFFRWSSISRVSLRSSPRVFQHGADLSFGHLSRVIDVMFSQNIELT